MYKFKLLLFVLKKIICNNKLLNDKSVICEMTGVDVNLFAHTPVFTRVLSFDKKEFYVLILVLSLVNVSYLFC